MLSYLLLGVVRIYSEKVKYLLADYCKEHLNDVRVTKNSNKGMGTIPPSLVHITMPHSFELDAYDQELLDDVGGSHQIPQEEIMLMGDNQEFETCGQYSLQKDAAETYECVINYKNKSGESLQKFCEEQFSLEECMDLQMNFPELVVSEKKTCELAIEDQINFCLDQLRNNFTLGSPSYNLSTEASMEKLRDIRISQQEPLGHEKVDEEILDLLRPEEVPPEKDQTTYSGMDSSECLPNHILSKEKDVSTTHNMTPELKFPVASGATTPEFMVIQTPAKKESALRSRKRKCLFDEVVVLSNKAIRKNLDNSKDLICKQKEVPHTVFDAWKAHQIFNLSHDFWEPLFPYSSPKLRSLFDRKKLPASEPVSNGDDVLEFSNVPRSSEQTVITPGTPVESTTVTILDKLEPQAAPAPNTPVDLPTSKRFHKGLKPSDSGSTTSLESEGREQLTTEQNLSDEDICSYDKSPFEGKCGKPSTRISNARVLWHLRRRQQPGKAGSVSLFDVLHGRAKKESAILFYEILVLKTKGCINVRQDEAYGDILVLDLPK